MISDTLSHAVKEIRRYREQFPDAHNGLQDEIDRVVSAMDALRIRLDTPPLTVNVNHVIPPDDLVKGPYEYD